MSGRKKISGFAQGLLESMQQALAYMKGNGPARETMMELPDPPPAFSTRRILMMRRRFGMTQAQFAHLLNVSSKTIEGWEQGARTPSGSALRLLQVIDQPMTFGPIARHSGVHMRLGGGLRSRNLSMSKSASIRTSRI